ncbi:MAG: hypothetical protein HY904_20120 [Deltaproteobacteria bacterium]|nr:hypothetical protein [Deltaproteobacteria bacterium]
MNTRATLPLLALAAALAACTTPSATDGGPDAGTVDAGGAADGGSDAGVVVPDAGPPLRTVAENAPLFGDTSAFNLLQDPLFTGLFSSSMSFFGLETTSGGMNGAYTLPFDRATPSRTPGMTVLVRSGSGKPTALAMFAGGRGPFLVEVWGALTDDAGKPYRSDQITVRVGEAWLGSTPGVTWAVPYMEGDDRVVGGRTWFRYAATVPDNLPSMCLFVAEGSVGGMDLVLAGPQVVPLELREAVPGQPPRPRTVQATRARWTPADLPMLQRAREHLPGLAPPALGRRELLRPRR